MPLQDIPVLRMAYFTISHHRPCGRWCSARLIRQAETLELQPRSRPPSKRTALSVGKHSCFRFAALALRLRTETTLWDVPVLRSAYFTQRVHSTLCSKTLDLQVRCANPTGNFAPKRPFGTFRCSVRLIRLCRSARTSAASRPTKGS